MFTSSPSDYLMSWLRLLNIHVGQWWTKIPACTSKLAEILTKKEVINYSWDPRGQRRIWVIEKHVGTFKVFKAVVVAQEKGFVEFWSLKLMSSLHWSYYNSQRLESAATGYSLPEIRHIWSNFNNFQLSSWSSHIFLSGEWKWDQSFALGRMVP